MLPKLDAIHTLSPLSRRFIAELRQSGFQGNINTDAGTRLVNATDNSAYQLIPQTVLTPRCQADVVLIFQLAQLDRFHTINFTPRGGGTGTNGQSLNSGFIVDCSKYMNNVLELNLAEGWIKVEPGVVLDQLNDYLKPHGIFFPLAISPSNRATLGGMANTDACGKGSIYYGKTSDHIIELTTIYSDGTIHTSHEVNLNTLEHLKQQPGLLGNIYRQIDDTVCRCQQKIAQQFPKITRRMTGYNLAQVYSTKRDQFNLNAILIGSEGTLGIVTELKLKLTPLPKFKKLVVLQYHSFDAALHHGQRLLNYQPAAIETIDQTLMRLAKTDIVYSSVKNYLTDPKAKALTLVEFIGESEVELNQQIQALLNEATSPASSIKQVHNEADYHQLWELRKKSVGLLGKTASKRKPTSGMEDTAVPPEQLAEFIRDFRALLDEKGLQYGMFGHIDAGCLHVRPALDLSDPNDEALYHELSDKVAELTHRYGGLMWGEHGKGFRSQYTPLFFGEELYNELRKIKQSFDPYNQLNPGKIATPFDLENKVVTITAKKRGHFDRRIEPRLRDKYNNPLSCNGNGACFNYATNNVMCPSYKVTRDRRHSPKGRASLIREWLRLLTLQNKSSQLFNFRWLNTLQKNLGSYDFSNEVYEAMRGCLGCKACATQCPINIDIPNSKAKFLATYHTRYLRSWRDLLIAHSEQIAKLQSKLPWLWRLIGLFPLSKHLLKVFFRLVDTPLPSSPGLAKLARRHSVPILSVNQLLAHPDKNKLIVIVQDWLTSTYQASLVIAAYKLLNKLGYQTYLLKSFPNGKPLHNAGYLKRFHHLAQHNAKQLSKLSQAGITLVGIEPSITLTYRQEYREALSNTGFTVHLFEEWLSQQNLDFVKKDTPDNYILLMHCSEQAAATIHAQQWQAVFEKFGLGLTIPSVGCCGMAGSYGHELEHQANSKQLYQMSWQPLITQQQLVLASGFSCHCQLSRLSNKKLAHPIEILLQA